MDLDTSGFWEIVGNKETITYFERDTDAAFDPTAGTTVTDAKRRAPTKLEQSLGGGLLRQTQLVWHLWTEKLGSIVPKIGDVIEDSASVRWTVTLVEIQSYVQRYRLTCQREV